jgi:Xaa-Pro aminopeptidase
VFDYGERRRRLGERMRAAGIDLLFLAPSADLEYLTGLERQIPTFGRTWQASDWISGAFFRPEREPVFLLPRMAAVFEISGEVPGELVVVNERDDAFAAFERVASGLGPARRAAVGDRVWAETVLNLQRVLGGGELVTGSGLVGELRRTKSAEELAVMERACRVADETMGAVSPRVVPGVTMNELAEEVDHQMRIRGSRTSSFTTRVFTGPGDDDLDSEGASGTRPLREGQSVMFDFGAVVDGYCSDFGRAVFCGQPSDEDREVYAVMLAAQEAGRAATRPGVPAREVNRACRAPIEEAGLGEHFMHRMGHGIGLDVHERPFLSEEDETPLEASMTFTDEPSILRPGRLSVRIEDVIVCEAGGGRKLNGYPPDLVANG